MSTTAGSAPDRQKLLVHEDAAHEKRNWVRLTFDCNNHCVFCLDTLTHDGEMRDGNDVKHQILDGRKKGAERLILSGGEPTIHPQFTDFVRLGAMAGYRKIQTVTNGRMFAYPEFLRRALDAGLSEITFSIHGPNARIHDALVGVKGAFEQEITGLKAALADGRPIVNVDVVINRGNVKHLSAILEMCIALGVREFDLLQVIPFGNAFTEGRDILFYDLEEMRPHLLEAFAYSKRPDLHIWLNRFPVKHLDGYEHLIQDPYKLNDEVRGRKEEFARMLYDGLDLDCRDPARCRYCYLEPLCDTLYGIRDQVDARRFEVLRVDAAWEAKQEPVFGGDPASAKRAQREPDKRYLPVLGQATATTQPPRYAEPATLAAEAGADTLWVCAPDLDSALATIARFPTMDRLELELERWDGLAGALGPGDTLGEKKLVRARVRGAADAQALLQLDAGFEVDVALTRETAPWLLSLQTAPARLALTQPTYERLTEAAEHDVDRADFFARFRHEVPISGLPACVIGRPPRAERPTVDTAMMAEDGRLEIFRYAKRYVREHYRTRSLRCRGCVHEDGCRGLHINDVRAHGFSLLQPVVAG